jgi:uncharacterized membrane protein (DUF4010 family)
MAAVSCIWLVRPFTLSRKSAEVVEDGAKPYQSRKDLPLTNLGSPVSIGTVSKFAALFIAIQIAGTLAQRYIGDSGLQIVSAIGGLVSSAGATAAAADLSFHGKAGPLQVAIAVVLASIASVIIDLPILRRQPGGRRVLRGITLATVIQIAAGAGALLLEAHLARMF